MFISFTNICCVQCYSNICFFLHMFFQITIKIRNVRLACCFKCKDEFFIQITNQSWWKISSELLLCYYWSKTLLRFQVTISNGICDLVLNCTGFFISNCSSDSEFIKSSSLKINSFNKIRCKLVTVFKGFSFDINFVGYYHGTKNYNVPVVLFATSSI